MIRLTVLLFLALPALSLTAQKRMFIQNGCAVNTAEMGRNAYVFEPNEEAVAIITAIMDANFLEPNFIIRSGDVENAVALVDQGQRFIIYNTTYIEKIKSSAGTDWGAIFIFAHEIGHHLNFHSFDLSDKDARHEQELKADIFAGGMLCRLGATLSQAQSGIQNIASEKESDTHPPRRARMEAVASGWKRAQTQNPAQPRPFSLPAHANTPSAAIPDDGLVFVRGGTYTMGCASEQQDCSDDEKPAHTVTVGDFFIGRYEVTQKLWTDLMGNNPSRFKNCDDCPVENVSWDDVQEFLIRLNVRYPGRNYRLPTEAEWEYAARGGGRQTMFGNGKNVIDPHDINFDARASHKKPYSVAGQYREKTVPVGSLNSPNALSLHDMSGNVWEWCADWYDSDYYKNTPSFNPTGPTSGFGRVQRGGSWNHYPQYCRVALRDDGAPGGRNSNTGFRLARTN